MTLGEIKAQFQGLLNNKIVNNNSALVSTFIDQGLMRIQRELRVPFMERQVMYTIPADYTKLNVPNDLLQLISLQVDRDGDGVLEYQLQRVDMNRVMQASQTIGHPTMYSRQGGSWYLGCTPSEGDSVLICYYAEIPELDGDDDENTATRVAWDAIIYAALTAAAEYLGDERLVAFEQRYQQIIRSLQEQADADELTADATVRPALYFEDDC